METRPTEPGFDEALHEVGRIERDADPDIVDEIRRPEGAPTPIPLKGLRKAVLLFEKKGKEVFFDCRMCGQCILHSTGLTCPMTCPKNLRNGPCGGTRLNGNCEVLPDKPCIWVLAWKRSRKMPMWRNHMLHVNPPVDFQLKDTGSWENLVTRRDKQVPAGWKAYDERTGAKH